MSQYVIAIVGRPNVGKSTLFNRLIGSREAIVEAEPGVTRDRIYGEAEWAGRHFVLVDTGGIIPHSDETFDVAIRLQAQLAIDEANTILFMVDGRDGVSPIDEEIGIKLRQSGKHIVLVVNKCDAPQHDNNAVEFYSLGLGEPFSISAMNGRSTGEFLDEATKDIPVEIAPDEDPRLKIAIVGRPNVGKSSITNALLGVERTIVTPIPGTTRDAIDSTMKFYGEEIVLIDTAGLRKKSHIKEAIEMYSTIRTGKAIERCDVAVVVIDAQNGMEHQDKTIIQQVIAARKGIIIAVNKWDLVEKETNTSNEFSKKLQDQMVTANFAPSIFISALTKQRVTKVVELAKEIQARRATRVGTSKLNQALLPEFERTTPPAVRGMDLRINYITQVSTEPPVFAFFCNNPDYITEAYKRFMEHKLREHFDLEGVVVSFIFRRKSKPREE